MSLSCLLIISADPSLTAWLMKIHDARGPREGSRRTRVATASEFVTRGSDARLPHDALQPFHG